MRCASRITLMTLVTLSLPLLPGASGCDRDGVTKNAGSSSPVGTPEPKVTTQSASSLIWTRLTFNRSWGPCPKPGTCQESYRVSSTGAFVYTGPENLLQKNLEANKMAEIQTVLDAPEFQRGTVQGFGCSVVTDVSVDLVLELPQEAPRTKTMLAGCLVPESTSPLAKLFRLLQQART